MNTSLPGLIYRSTNERNILSPRLCPRRACIDRIERHAFDEQVSCVLATVDIRQRKNTTSEQSTLGWRMAGC
jgi:hypothetical protein